jgi:hypothetical protein
MELNLPHRKQCVNYKDQPVNTVLGNNRCFETCTNHTNTPCRQKAHLHTGTALFSVIIQRPLQMGPIGCPEMSARNYHYTLCNNPKELSVRVLRVGSPKSSRFSHLQAMAATELRHPKAGDTLSSRHVSSCDVNACSWDVRGDLTLNSMAQIHTCHSAYVT